LKEKNYFFKKFPEASFCTTNCHLHDRPTKASGFIVTQSTPKKRKEKFTYIPTAVYKNKKINKNSTRFYEVSRPTS